MAWRVDEGRRVLERLRRLKAGRVQRLPCGKLGGEGGRHFKGCEVWRRWKR
jgi:hypothetical protein